MFDTESCLAVQRKLFIHNDFLTKPKVIESPFAQIREHLINQRNKEQEEENIKLEQQKIELEKERQRQMAELERQRQIAEEEELERQRQAELERQRQIEEEEERQRQIAEEEERQRQIEEEEERQRQIALANAKREKQFKIPSGQIVRLPEDYSTDDQLEVDVVNTLNNTSLPWKVVKKGKDFPITISLRKIDGPGEFMVKNEVIIPYPKDFIIKALTDLETEQKWHKAASGTKILSSGQEEDFQQDIRYNYTKFPWPLSDRDWVIQRKWWFNYGGDSTQGLLLTKSCEHSDYPAKEKPVRAMIYIQGHHFQELDNGQTKLTMISQADIKISAMKGMIEKKMPEGQMKYFEEMLKGFKKLE
ncbi:MAG: START domain-containing protein [archaeon]|nr:START domain-containing protein [archaeon]